MIKILCVLMVLSLGMVGCSGDSPSTVPVIPPASSNGILPLKVGNFWVYEVENPQTGITRTVRWEIAETMETEGQVWFELRYTENGQLLAERRYLRNTATGLYLYAYVDASGTFHQLEAPHLLISYPARINSWFDSWEAESAKLRATHKDIGVPAGSFECLKYEFYNDDSMTSAFWTPHVGLINQFNFIYSSSGVTNSSTWRLVDYHVN
ncbi:MAG: hypothetical protein D6675_11930 [Gemmatimonadetes bacterium]|nr:MAG: hypothetical protein D6675_11930 [Gemmatimonadota bacterium]